MPTDVGKAYEDAECMYILFLSLAMDSTVPNCDQTFVDKMLAATRSKLIALKPGSASDYEVIDPYAEGATERMLPAQVSCQEGVSCSEHLGSLWVAAMYRSNGPVDPQACFSSH